MVDFASTSSRYSGCVVVAGAGAAGMAAAISAARQGARVQLVDVESQPGGTVANGFIHTLGGVYDQTGQLLNNGLVAELADRLSRASSLTRQRRIGKTCCLTIVPEIYRDVVAGLLDAEQKIEQLYNSRITGVVMKRDRVSKLEIALPQGRIKIKPRAIVDTTGTGRIVRMIDPRLICDDSQRAAGGLIIRLRGAQPGAVAFPKGLKVIQEMRDAAGDGTLPSVCRHAWLDSGAYEDEVYVKLFVPLDDGWQIREQRERIMRNAQRAGSSIIEFLRRRPEFSGTWAVLTGELGVRDGGRIRGEYCLTENDVRAAQKFDDGICRCSWPIEYWNPSNGLELEYLDDGSYYEIPLRCLKVQGVENVWAAGKCLSADHRAQASARVVGSCWTMGEAAGRAAAN